jgi:hypothetical protein
MEPKISSDSVLGDPFAFGVWNSLITDQKTLALSENAKAAARIEAKVKVIKAQEFILQTKKVKGGLTPSAINSILTKMTVKPNLTEWHRFLQCAGFYPPPSYQLRSSYISDFIDGRKGCVCKKNQIYISLFFTS